MGVAQILDEGVERSPTGQLNQEIHQSYMLSAKGTVHMSSLALVCGVDVTARTVYVS